MSMNDPYSPSRIVDRLQIQDAIFRYCRGIDRQDYDAVRSTYHSDAIDLHGPYQGSVDGLIEWMKDRHKSVPFSLHSVTNMLIEFADNDLAIVETYMTCTQYYPAESKATLSQLSGGESGKAGVANHLVLFARYIDRVERRDGLWKVGHRTIAFDSSMMFEESPNAPRAGQDWVIGLRSKNDPLYRERAKAGIVD